MHILVHYLHTIEFPGIFDSILYRGLAEFTEFTEIVNENRKNSTVFVLVVSKHTEL